MTSRERSSNLNHNTFASDSQTFMKHKHASFTFVSLVVFTFSWFCGFHY